MLNDNRDDAIYEPPFRPPYEYVSMWAWAVSALGSAWTHALFGAPRVVAVACAAVSLAMAAWRGGEGRRLQAERDRLSDGGGLWFIGARDANERFRNAALSGKWWFGEGFEWTPQVAEVMHHVLSEGVDQVTGPDALGHGAYWLHALAKPADLCEAESILDGHTFIVGTTRQGKTRFFDLFIAQAVGRGWPVIVIDPKGDHDLKARMEMAYRRTGHPEKFHIFSPAHPESSVCIDPLKNWNRPTEVASRVAALIATEGGGDPFQAFSWRVLNNLVQGLLMVGRRPSLVELRHLIEGGLPSLVTKVLRAYCEKHAKPEEYSGYVKNARKQGGEMEGYIRFYREVLADPERAPSLELEGLISDAEHDRDHLSKMITSLTPVLTMLTSPPLDKLLSPSPDDQREAVDLAGLIRSGQGLYVSLDSLSDPTVGSAIGSMLLADMAAVAGDRYAYNPKSSPVMLLVDESAEVTNAQLVQILNKGAGAGIRAVVAAQTIADFEARFGNTAQARQMIGNLNNVISFRLQDPQTAKQLSDGLPKARVRNVTRNYSQGVGVTPTKVATGGYGEGLKEEEKDLFPAALFHQLPPLHYIARFSDGRIVKGRIPIQQD